MPSEVHVCRYSEVSQRMSRAGFINVPLLSKSACHDLTKKLLASQSYWIARGSRADFCTLGRATYMDLAGQRPVLPAYLEEVDVQNRILQTTFGPLLESLGTFLSSWTGRQVCFLPWLPLPGFHMWLGSGIPETRGGSVHFDLQFEALVRLQLLEPPDSTLSFTLPIAMPRTGAGLRIWNIHRSSAAELDSRSLNRTAAYMEPYEVRYQLGHITVHSGLWLHQIAPATKVEKNDLRFMLQGHAVLNRGRWIAYW